MSLGSAFPPGMRKENAEKNLRPGAVIRIYCDFTTPAKEKYLLVVCTSPLLAFMINSNQPKFVQFRPHLQACQVLIESENHTFLDHDSWAHCVEVHETLDLEELIDLEQGDPSSIVKGHLTEERIKEIIIASNQSPVLERRKKKIVTEALNQSLSEHY